MRKLLPAAIAWRYMRSRGSHSAVRAISAVAVCGVAVATAAIICVLSVFNGFRDVIGNRLDTLAPDVLVSPASGKVFSDADSLTRVISKVDGVAQATPTLTDHALALYQGREMPVTLKGVDFDAWRRVTSVDSIIADGGSIPRNFLKESDAPAESVLSIGAAARLGITPADTRLLLFAPRREGRVNPANPGASFITDSISVAAIYEAQQSEYDADMVVVPIAVARELFQRYDAEGSAVEVKAAPGVDASDLARRLADRLGGKAVVKDRLAQQEMNFRMIQIEKWVTFLLLFFILVIASFNIIGTLCMAVIEKSRSLSTLHALGFTRRQAGAVFGWESMLVCLAGGAAGILLGVTLVLLQQHFGFIRLDADPEALIVTAYPVKLKVQDILITLVPILITGGLTALVASSFARQRVTTKAGDK